ncbi:hypothetical protein DXG03_005317 [Asterophora parasitica]|uniref:Uncharacterized protein n=1 Tax=Asterophora parasitica TaxID=117018 RepID=A0A9P7KED0_9AGAR|nr:hypothetical protein DXG03_005317 [Asterophora parasitica]
MMDRSRALGELKSIGKPRLIEAVAGLRRLEIAELLHLARQRAVVRKLQAWEDDILQRETATKNPETSDRQPAGVTAPGGPSIDLMERQEEPAVFTTQHIVLGSTIVTCGAGLEIRHVVNGFDDCRIIIHNLPADVTIPEITTIFTQQGLSADEIMIISVNPICEGSLDAVVLVSAEQGVAIAAGGMDSRIRNEILWVEVKENPAANAMDMDVPQTHTDILRIFSIAPNRAVSIDVLSNGEESDVVLDAHSES